MDVLVIMQARARHPTHWNLLGWNPAWLFFTCLAFHWASARPRSDDALGPSSLLMDSYPAFAFSRLPPPLLPPPSSLLSRNLSWSLPSSLPPYALLSPPCFLLPPAFLSPPSFLPPAGACHDLHLPPTCLPP